MNLTASELLFVDRSTRGLTQREAAEAYGTSFWVYRSWENNPNAVPEEVAHALAHLHGKEVPKPLYYVVLRRRKGMTQSKLAAELGVSRQWINQMERGEQDDDLLHDYWST